MRLGQEEAGADPQTTAWSTRPTLRLVVTTTPTLERPRHFFAAAARRWRHPRRERPQQGAKEGPAMAGAAALDELKSPPPGPDEELRDLRRGVAKLAGSTPQGPDVELRYLRRADGRSSRRKVHGCLTATATHGLARRGCGTRSAAGCTPRRKGTFVWESVSMPSPIPFELVTVEKAPAVDVQVGARRPMMNDARNPASTWPGNEKRSASVGLPGGEACAGDGMRSFAVVWRKPARVP